MKFILSLFLFYQISAYAFFVNPELGNVTNTSIDCISKNKEHSIKLERFFNSSAKQVGWFGAGYGSPFETFIKVEADGSLTLHDYGQSPGRAFFPKNKTVKTAQMIEQLIEKKKSTIQTSSIETLKKRLQLERNFRIEMARELGLAGVVSEGDIFESHLHEGEVITFLKDKFVKKTVDGKKHVFSKLGLLLEISDDRSQQVISLVYNDKSQVKSIRDNFSNQLNLSWDLNGRLVAVTSVVDGKGAQYSYQNGYLAKVTNQANDIYRYEFDNKRNLSKLIYPNNSFIQIKYDPNTRQPKLISYSDKTRTEYSFENKVKNGASESLTLEKKFGTDGQLIGESKWVYRSRLNPEGVKQILSQSYHDGLVTTETTYRSCCYPQPEKIASGGEWVEFSYDVENRLTGKKHSSGRILKISYDGSQQVSGVDVNGTAYRFRHHPQTSELLEFESPHYRMNLAYKGDLIAEAHYQRGQEKSKQKVNYDYDRTGRLVAIKYNDKVLVNYEYNGSGRQTHFPAKEAEMSEKLLNEIDSMMMDMMVLKEVSYSL